MPAPQRKTLSLTDKALAAWKENRAQIENKLAPTGEWEHIRDIASKTSANIHYYTVTK